MSYYMRVNQWSGLDRDNAVAQLAKIFRMEPEAASRVLDQIVGGQPWQFEHSISPGQSEQAQTFLTEMGFDIELIPVSEAGLAEFSQEEPPEIGEFEPSAKTSKPAKPKSKSSVGAVAFLILVLLAGGLFLTDFGKEQLAQWGLSEPVPETTTSGGAGGSKQTIRGLEGIPYDEKNFQNISSSQNGCLDSIKELEPVLLKEDLKQTQSDFFCKDNTIANPKGDWKCEFEQEKNCGSGWYYHCFRNFNCVAETPEYNRAKFKRQLEELKKTAMRK